MFAQVYCPQCLLQKNKECEKKTLLPASGPSWAIMSLSVRVSRFEVDLNREKEKAIYFGPEDSWGLEVWKKRPSSEEIEKSLAIHKEFYDQLGAFLEKLIEKHGRVLLLDIHSYGHRREGGRACSGRGKS